MLSARRWLAIRKRSGFTCQRTARRLFSEKIFANPVHFSREKFQPGESRGLAFHYKPASFPAMSIAPKPHSALLIVGHGSTENPDSSTPYFEHADEIRRRGLFAEVHCCFWKEEPSMREALYMIDSDEVYVVPDFISEGYFTQEVIPRELQLAGPSTVVRGKTLHYCLPVGVHPSMTGLILRRAKEVAPGVNPAETTLIITGHGTGLNENSTKAIRDQARLIAASGAAYAEVLDAYMEEQPFIAEWNKLAATPNVIVVPFFIADGLHSYQDIPVLLGIENEVGPAASQREVFRRNPHILRGKTLYYSSAIGTERLIADVILDQVADFDQLHK
jgi:sirohydrochlorin cobaltochelatase